MPLGFYITDKGRELIDRAIPTENKVVITKACFGSGGSVEQEVDYSITELKNQFYEKELDPSTDSYGVDPNDPTAIYIKSIVPTEVTGTINEVGYKDADDNLIIYGVVRERTKLGGTQGEGEIFQYQNWIRLEPGDVEKIEINILSPEYEKFEQALESKVDKEEGKVLITTEELAQIQSNKEDILTIKTELEEGGSTPLLLVIRGSESFEGKNITATCTLDKKEYKATIENGMAMIKVKLPGEYVITNDYNDTSLTAVVGEPLKEEVYFTDFYGSINVAIPELLVGETIEAKNGEHTVEKKAESTVVQLDVYYQGSWEVGVKGSEHVAKQTVELQEIGQSGSCTLSTSSGVPYITVTVVPELVGETVICKKDLVQKSKVATTETVQFFISELGEYTICLESSDKLAETVNVNEAKEFKVTLDLEDLTTPVLIVSSKEEDDGKTIKVSRSDTVLQKVLVNKSAVFVLPEQGVYTITCDDYPENTKTVNANANKVFKCAYRALVFGYKVTQGEPDPKRRIEPLEDLVGLTPITVDQDTGRVDYGDMEGTFLFEAFNNPVLKNIDKSEDIELDPYDYSQKKAGGVAPDASITSNYNALSRVPKLYSYLTKSQGVEYCYISDEKIDDNYEAIGFIKEDGSEADYAYLAMFGGSYDNQNRLRSVSGNNLRNNTNYTDFANAARKNGDGYTMETHALIEVYQNAVLMMTQNFDSQTAVGRGRDMNSGATNTTKETTGFANDKGPIYYDPNTKAIKFMHIEDLWFNSGYSWEEGIHCQNSKTYVRMRPPYITSASGGLSTYTQVPDAATTSGSISSSSLDNKWGRIPSAVSGSSSTYECDNWYPGTGSDIYVSHRGGLGLFFRAVYYSFSYSNDYIVARLSLLP